ncbi:UNVERIFIED_CONTAM: hypothetical protein GTU68_037000 [Idotea baltica]|nr:hypothetical protein [Idotea baltica]
MTVGDLAEPLEMSLPAASKHLKVLERAGLLNRRRDGQRYYMKLNAAPLKSAADWIKYYERFWSESFDRLDDFLEQRSKNDEK